MRVARLSYIRIGRPNRLRRPAAGGKPKKGAQKRRKSSRESLGKGVRN